LAWSNWLGRLKTRGFGVALLPEHRHIPVRRETPWSGGGEPPRVLRIPSIHSLPSAPRLPSQTRIKLGTGICLVIQRDPIVLAKEVASLDLLSGGRFLFGVGAGCAA